MHLCNVTITLLYFLEVSLIFGNIFQIADGRDNGAARRKGASGLIPCPHPKCQCKVAKKGGIGVNCDKAAGSLPKFLNVNTTFEILSVSKRNITSLPASGFDGIQTRILDVGNNPLEEISEAAFQGLEKNLNVLWMNDCSLRDVPSGSLAVLKHLTVLHFEGNRLSLIPARFLSGMPHLKELYLAENLIQSIDVAAFAHVTSLDQLKLGRNRIRSLPPRVFAPLVNLTSLDLAENYLQAVTPGVMDGLKSLRWLELNYNQIRSLERDSFRGIRNLRNLKMENNPLAVVADGAFRAVGKLGYLSLDFTNATVLTNGTFVGLVKLKTLVFGEIPSPGGRLPAGLLSSARTLKHISFTDNQGEFGGLWKNMFSEKLAFKNLNVFVKPAQVCKCSVPWIRELTGAGAYVKGYCLNSSPLSCTSKSAKAGKRENEERLKLKDGQVRGMFPRRKTTTQRVQGL